MKTLPIFKHGEEVRRIWAEYQRRCRAKKRGVEYPPKEYYGNNEKEMEIPVICHVLTITEDEEKIWALTNIFKRGL